MIKRSIAALVLAAVTAAPAVCAPSLMLRGIASGNHPFALFEIDHATYLLGVGDTIDGRTIRAIGMSGVRLNDGTTLHVSGSDEPAPAGTTVLRAASHRPQVVTTGEDDFYDIDTEVETPYTQAGFSPFYDGYGYDFPPLGYSVYPFDGYGYGIHRRHLERRSVPNVNPALTIYGRGTRDER